MRGISWPVHILRDRSKLLRLKLAKLFPNENFSGEKDSGKVLIIIIILFLIIFIFFGREGVLSNPSLLRWGYKFAFTSKGSLLCHYEPEDSYKMLIVKETKCTSK